MVDWAKLEEIASREAEKLDAYVSRFISEEYKEAILSHLGDIIVSASGVLVVMVSFFGLVGAFILPFFIGMHYGVAPALFVLFIYLMLYIFFPSHLFK